MWQGLGRWRRKSISGNRKPLAAARSAVTLAPLCMLVGAGSFFHCRQDRCSLPQRTMQRTGPPDLQVPQSVPDVIKPKPNHGEDRSMPKPCRRQLRELCWAISTMHKPSISAPKRAFSARTAASLLKPRERTASKPSLQSSTRSGSIHSSNTWWNFPMAGASGSPVCMGYTAQGRGRPALVSSLSNRRHPAIRSAALDRAAAKLELHVRGMPLDQRAQELRCADGQLSNHLLGGERWLRGLSRSWLLATSIGCRAAGRQM